MSQMTIIVKEWVAKYLKKYESCISIENIPNTGGDHHPSDYESWLDFWCKKTQKKVIPPCSNIECSNKAKYGGHVKKVGDNDKSSYIIPICQSCNQLGDIYLVYGNVKFIPVPKD